MLLLVALRVAVGFLPVPVGLIPATSILATVGFVAAPIYGLFRAASYSWTWPRAGAMLVACLALWSGGAALAGFFRQPLASGVALAISQQALVGWCLAIGTMLALRLKERNMLLPIAIFLALFDLWLVLSPMGVVNHDVVQGAGKGLASVGYQVPAPQQTSGGGRAAALAYVGPADYLFLSMFLVSLFRFNMRTRETFRWSVPVLCGYLLFVLFAGAVRLHLGPIPLWALPALVPIGLVVLVVNRKEFHLARDEKIATYVIAIGGSAFVIWSIFFVKPPPPPPLPPTDGPEAPAPARTPSPEGRGQFPSEPPRAPRNKPGLR